MICQNGKTTSFEMWLLGVLQKRFPKKFTKKYLCCSLFLKLLKSFRSSGLQLYWRGTPALVFQNQPFVVLLQHRCSCIIHQIHRKTLMLALVFQEHLVLQNISSGGCSCKFQVSSLQLHYKETTAKMFFCEFCKILKDIFTFDRTPPDNCFLCLSVNFGFFRTLLLNNTSGKLLFRAQVEEFQPPYTVKNYFTGPFKRFIQEREVAIRRRLFT